MRRDPRVSTTADPAQRGVESDPRRWPARSLAWAQTIAQTGLRTLANDSNGPKCDRPTVPTELAGAQRYDFLPCAATAAAAFAATSGSPR